MEPQDTITIAPSVLITVTRHAALSVKGVSRMGNLPAQVGHLLRGHPMGQGIALEVEDNTVKVELYVVVDPGVKMRDASQALQQTVKRAIEELVGMQVLSVNVHVEDVDVRPDESGDAPDSAG